MDTSKIKCAYDELIPVSKLLLLQNPLNPNKHSKEQIDRLAKIIDFAGQRSPIVISKRSNLIIKGHGRLMALSKLNWESAAVDFQEYDTDASEYQDMIADNEIARWAELDEEKFLADLKDIDLGDIELLGIKELPEIMNFDPGDESEQVKLDVKKMTKCPSCGDIFDHAKNQADS